jgi:hypothetical protein
MADYYSILVRAVSGLEPNTGKARKQLYDRARSAVISEMERAYPPFHGSEVADAKQALENAIEMVEAEAVRRKSNKMGVSTLGDPGRVIAVSIPRSIPKNGEVHSSGRTTFIRRIVGFKKEAPRRDTWLSELLERASCDADDDEQDFAPKQALRNA